MRRRHIECMRALIGVALEDGDFLEGAWERVLEARGRTRRDDVEHPDLLS